MKKPFLIILSVVFVLLAHSQKFENLAMVPPMGWNSWNTFQTNISESLVMQIADDMVRTGMKDAGYQYIVLDDGWMSMKRDSISGDLVADPVKFPHGMKYLSDYVHSKGLKFGLYNCAGTKTCAGYPGTRGYEYQDARLYARFGIDYLKFDWCNTEGINAKEAYQTMSKALRAAGRPIIFSLCEWGTSKPWEWAEPVGQLWRTTGDIYAQFDSVHHLNGWAPLGVKTIADLQEGLRKYAGPGHWNDPDMLEVGNGMSLNEDRSHFSIWAMLAAPLIAGNDLRKMSAQTASLLTNKEIIAVDQDKKGIEGFVYRRQDSLEIFCKPLDNREWAICFLNRGTQPLAFQFNWMKERITDSLNHLDLDLSHTYSIRDLWQHKEVGNTSSPLKVSLEAHDVMVVRLKPLK